MENGNSRVVVAFTTDRNYIYYTGVAISTMLEHISAANRYHLVILSTGLELTELDFIQSLTAPYPNVDWEPLNVSSWVDSIGKEKFFVGNINIATYYRLALITQLKEEPRIIYLDSDIIVQGDIAELWNTDLGGCAVAAARDLYASKFPWSPAQRRFLRYCRQVLKLKSSADFFNAGVTLMDLEALRRMDFQNAAQKLIVAGSRFNTEDQDIMNILLDGKCLLLDSSWNRIGRPDHRHSERDHIVHFAGLAPWRSEHMPKGAAWWRAARRMPFFPEVMKNYPQRHAKYLEEMQFEVRYYEVLRSSCWKITAPIRWVKDGIRWCCQFLKRH